MAYPRARGTEVSAAVADADAKLVPFTDLDGIIAIIEDCKAMRARISQFGGSLDVECDEDLADVCSSVEAMEERLFKILRRVEVEASKEVVGEGWAGDCGYVGVAEG